MPPVRVAVRIAGVFVRESLESVLAGDSRFVVVEPDAETSDAVLLDEPAEERSASHRYVLLRRSGAAPPQAADDRPLADLLTSLENRCSPSDEEASAGHLSPLSSRECELLRALAVKGTSRAVAEHLGLSAGAVDRQKQRIFAKLEARNLAHALAIAYDSGWLPVASARPPDR